MSDTLNYLVEHSTIRIDIFAILAFAALVVIVVFFIVMHNRRKSELEQLEEEISYKDGTVDGIQQETAE